jgi:hypothetical protein
VLGKEPWTHLSLPAIAETEGRAAFAQDRFHIRHPGDLLHESRESRNDLDRIKSTIGSFNFASQYQQNPIPVEGEIVKWQWFRFYDELPTRKPGDFVAQSFRFRFASVKRTCARHWTDFAAKTAAERTRWRSGGDSNWRCHFDSTVRQRRGFESTD